MKKLCFGSFATILSFCTAQGVTKLTLGDGLLRAIASDNYIATIEESVVSNYFRCERNLPKEVSEAARSIEAGIVAAYFKESILPLIDSNKEKNIVLALKDIIASDDSIDNDTVIDRVEALSKKELPAKSEIVLCDFLAGVFLHTAVNIKNTDGKPSIKEIDANYVNAFDSTRDIITVLKKKRDDFSSEIASELTPEHLLVLSSETGGKCQNCGRLLGVKNEGNEINYAKIFPVSEDEDIIVCVDCERELTSATDEKKAALLLDKRHNELTASALDAVARIKLENNIEEVLATLAHLEADETTGLNHEPIKVKNKITNPSLQRKVLFDVTTLYEAVKDILDRLSGEDRLNTERFAKSIRKMFLEAEDKLSSQSDIYNLLVDNMYNKIGHKHKEECEIIISYFVQNCEVFNEIAE